MARNKTRRSSNNVLLAIAPAITYVCHLLYYSHLLCFHLYVINSQAATAIREGGLQVRVESPSTAASTQRHVARELLQSLYTTISGQVSDNML